MKPTFLTSLALVSIFQPMNMLFASAHPSAPASAPAKLELNTKANCYTPPDVSSTYPPAMANDKRSISRKKLSFPPRTEIAFHI